MSFNFRNDILVNLNSICLNFYRKKLIFLVSNTRPEENLGSSSMNYWYEVSIKEVLLQGHPYWCTKSIDLNVKLVESAYNIGVTCTNSHCLVFAQI